MSFVWRINITRIFYFLACCALLFLFALVTKDYWLRGLGNFLVVEDVVKPADAIVVLAGHDEERVKYAVQLYNEKYATWIIMSGPQADKMKQEAVESGIPEDKILLEQKTVHTYQHPLFVKAILQGHGLTSAIVVSSPYHMRRTAMLFNRAFYHSGIKVMFCPVKKSWFNARRWWKTAESRRVVYSEYVKMAINVWGVRVNDALCALLKKQNQPVMIGY